MGFCSLSPSNRKATLWGCSARVFLPKRCSALCLITSHTDSMLELFQSKLRLREKQVLLSGQVCKCLVPRGSSRHGRRLGLLIKNPTSEVLGKEKRCKSSLFWGFFSLPCEKSSGFGKSQSPPILHWWSQGMAAVCLCAGVGCGTSPAEKMGHRSAGGLRHHPNSAGRSPVKSDWGLLVQRAGGAQCWDGLEGSSSQTPRLGHTTQVNVRCHQRQI